MKPKHEAFLLAYVEKFGFLFIIDRLKDMFPALSHKQACRIFDEFKAKHAEDKKVKSAEADLQAAGKVIADDIENVLRKAMEE